RIIASDLSDSQPDPQTDSRFNLQARYRQRGLQYPINATRPLTGFALARIKLCNSKTHEHRTALTTTPADPGADKVGPPYKGDRMSSMKRRLSRSPASCNIKLLISSSLLAS